MFKFLVNLYVSIFVPKKNRAYVKYRILGTLNRFKVTSKAKSVGDNLDCTSLYKISVTKNTTIGDNVTINGLIIQGAGNVDIGSYVHFGIDVMIIAENHNYEGTEIPFDDEMIKKDTKIGNFCWIGSRATILPGADIGEGAIIQAGAVVHGVIPPYSIAGGNPAKVFKMRNVEHFLKLKEEKHFHVGGKK